VTTSAVWSRRSVTKLRYRIIALALIHRFLAAVMFKCRVLERSLFGPLRIDPITILCNPYSSGLLLVLVTQSEEPTPINAIGRSAEFRHTPACRRTHELRS
jgi:hypothetical protein